MIFLQIVSQRKTIRCYECNVWKAGYGNLCEERKGSRVEVRKRIKEGCNVCISLITIAKIGYYRNTPRYSRIVSKVCDMSRQSFFSNECHTYKSGGGYYRKCYCNTDLCNSSDKVGSNWISSMFLALFGYIINYHIL